MLAHVQSSAIIGLDAVPVDVVVDVSPGIPAFAIVGLPDAAVRRAWHRGRSRGPSGDRRRGRRQRVPVGCPGALGRVATAQSVSAMRTRVCHRARLHRGMVGADCAGCVHAVRAMRDRRPLRERGMP